MSDSTYLPPSPATFPSSEKPKHSVLGIISLVCAILSVVLVCILFIAVFAVGGQVGFDANKLDYNTLAGLGFGIIALLCGSGLTVVVGIGLGIAAVVQKNTQKVFGILGLVLNVFVFFGLCGLFGLMMLNS